MQQGESARVTPAAHRQLLTELTQAFDAFRNSKESRSRVPKALRTLALQAMDAGITPKTLRQACGVTRSQLHDWQTGAKTRGRRTRERAQPVQVFAVKDDIQPELKRTTGESEMVLELGGPAWHLCLRIGSLGTAQR